MMIGAEFLGFSTALKAGIIHLLEVKRFTELRAFSDLQTSLQNYFKQ